MANWVDDGNSWAALGPQCFQANSTLVFSASDYPSGGYPVTPANFQLGRVRGLIPVAYQGNAEGYTWLYDSASGTVKAFNGTSQVSASSNFAPGQVMFQGSGY